MKFLWILAAVSLARTGGAAPADLLETAPAEAAAQVHAGAPAGTSGAPRDPGPAPAAPDTATAVPGTAVSPAARLPTDARALWVVRDALTSPSRVRRMVEEAHQGGVTDLIVQVRGRGDAYYDSDIVPIAPRLAQAWELNGRFDPLDMAVRLAHERGMRVHAWLNVYLVAGWGRTPDDNVIYRHPEWIAVNAQGIPMNELSRSDQDRTRVEGVFLEPGNVAVVREFLRVVDEIVTRYPVDGIHLDYIRYPLLDVGYSETMRSGFRRLTGVDPLELQRNREGLLQERGDRGYVELERRWWGFKADQVSALVKNVSLLCRSRRPGILISAAVKPEPALAFSEAGQDWTRWIRQGWIDVAAPMMYSPSGETVRRQVQTLVQLVPPDRVWAGIAVYNQSLGAAEAKIRTVRTAGVAGISLFSYSSVPGGASGLKRLNGR